MASRPPSTGVIPSGPPAESVNANIRAAEMIRRFGVERLQQVYSQSINPATQTQVNIPIQNVGLVRGFFIKVEAVIENTDDADALTRTPFGASNLLRSINFNDLNNQNRHATQGWHLGLVNSAKQPAVFGAAYSPNVPVGYGNNFDVMTAPATIADGETGEVQFYYYVPLCYSRYDFRGAMWAGVTNAVTQLQIQINPTPVVATGDAGLAVYSGTTGGYVGNVTITVHQDYVDQIPLDSNNNPILPLMDLATLYQLQNSTLSSLVENADFGVAFANFRSYMSTCLVYDNAGVYNAGTDINYFALQTANSSNIWKYDPEMAALLARGTFLADPPLGTYYFDHRAHPIATDQWGNTQITVNPSDVGSGASLWAGFEFFAQASQVVQAQSLPTGG